MEALLTPEPEWWREAALSQEPREGAFVGAVVEVEENNQGPNWDPVGRAGNKYPAFSLLLVSFHGFPVDEFPEGRGAPVIPIHRSQPPGAQGTQPLPGVPEDRLTIFFCILFFKRFYIFIHERHRKRGRDTGRRRSRLPAGLPDPWTPRSCPGPKADTQLLSRPGVPMFNF